MLVGTIRATTGACPVCGTAVPLAHRQNPVAISDEYACPSCGPTTYRMWSWMPGS